MIKTFCDRCEKEVTSEDKNYASETNRGHEYRVCAIGGCDLCKDCIIALQKFMKRDTKCEK